MPPRYKTPSATLFGRRLRELRFSLSCSQEQFGIMIGLDEGIARSRISRYETGKIRSPRTAAAQVSEALKIPLPYFYCEDDQQARLVLAFSRIGEAQRARILELAERLAAGLEE